MQTDIRYIFLDLGGTFRVIDEDPAYLAAARAKIAELCGVKTEDPTQWFEDVIDKRYDVYREWALKYMCEAPEEVLWRRWLAYDCEYLTSYVPNLDFSAEVSNGMTYGSYAKADAVETVKLYALLRQWAKQYNVSLTEEDEARLQQQRQQYVTYYGGEEGYQQQLQLLGISEDTFDSINRMYLLYARIHDLYTADGSAMHPTQEAIDAFAQEKGYVTVKLLYWPASGGENSQAQAEDFAARLSTAEDKDALYAEMAQQLGIEAGDTGRTFSAETLGDTLSAAFSALEPGQVSDVIATDEGWYVAIGQTLDESSVLDEMFT